MNKFAVFALLLLSACQPSQSPTPPPLANARMGGNFTLTNQDGKLTTPATFKGQYWAVYFGYTFCPDVCPVDARYFGEAVARFEKQSPERAKKLIPVFITGDPARDTPPVLKQFLANFHPRFVGLTGTEAQIDDVARAYGMPVSREKPDATGNYLVAHPRRVTLYGPDSKPIAFIPVDEGPEAAATELDRWIK